MIMEQDQTYTYFQTALWEWLEKTKADGEAPQKLLSIKMGITEGTVSKYVSPKREKPIPYEMQVAFANACGHDLLSFIKAGKNILDAKLPLFNLEMTATNTSPVIDLQTEADKKHAAVIAGFEDKEKAIKLNQYLIEIEKLSSDAMNDVEEWLEFKLNKLREKKGLLPLQSQKTGTTDEQK